MKLFYFIFLLMLLWLASLCGRSGHPMIREIKGVRFAHRGYHRKPQVPENSLPAFKAAVDRGWGAELDVHLLKDGTLAVFHDSQLKRCAGVDGIIEDLDLEGLRQLRLEGTDYPVPLFSEVLELFQGKTPLIIELKTWKGNGKPLAEAVLKELAKYDVRFVIESFDPRAVKAVRQLDDSICRGQLSCTFSKEENADLPAYQRFVLQNLMMNFLCNPDFIAYKFEDRNNISNKVAQLFWRIQPVSWTIRSKKDLETVEKMGSVPIFERFDPEGEETW